MSTSAPECRNSLQVRPYGLQVGGHGEAGAAPASLLDGQGRFLKKLQAGERGAREVTFYGHMEQHRLTGQQQQQQERQQEEQHQEEQQQEEQQQEEQQQEERQQEERQQEERQQERPQQGNQEAMNGSQAQQEGPGGHQPAGQQQHKQQQRQPQVLSHAVCSTCRCPLQHRLMQQLAAWVPLSYGTQQVGGEVYLVMEDLTGRYRHPCILDIKIGYRTWYAWASDNLKAKYRAKDESTTQGSLGFRLCGMMVQRPSAQQATGSSGSSGVEVTRRDRHWGKQLTEGTVLEALRAYADNGHLTLRDLCVGPGRLLDQLQCLIAVFEQQQCWHLFSASLLLVYEGTATTAAEARVALRLIDFAHAFPVVDTEQQQQQQQIGDAGGVCGPRGRDQNFLGGLQSLVRTLEKAL